MCGQGQKPGHGMNSGVGLSKQWLSFSSEPGLWVTSVCACSEHDPELTTHLRHGGVEPRTVVAIYGRVEDVRAQARVHQLGVLVVGSPLAGVAL